MNKEAVISDTVHTHSHAPQSKVKSKKESSYLRGHFLNQMDRKSNNDISTNFGIRGRFQLLHCITGANQHILNPFSHEVAKKKY